MNQHRSILAGLFALVLGVALWGGGCASGGQTSAQSGDDGGGMDGTAVTEGGGDAGGCAAGKTKCGGVCVATGTDPKNCGKCGTVCTSGQVCSQGACAAGCSGGETLCGGPPEAGAPEAGSGTGDSGGDDGGGSGQDSGGSPGVDSGSSSGVDAGAPYCANTNTDPMNCGGCGIVCGGTCTGGTCTVGSCPAGQVGCPASGTCIPMGTCCNSGECTITGQVCPMPGGQCACPSGERQCGTPLNSCVSTAACCTNADCIVTGQSCATPGQPCACNASLQCCVASDCPAEQNVSGAACTANKCIATCTAGCYDINSTYTDGCECCDTTGAGHTCATAAAPTSVAIGQVVNFTGTIPEPTGGDWYAVTFAPSPGNSTTFHPEVTLSANPNTEFVFEIDGGACGGAPLTCPTEGGSATGVTTWEIKYTAGDPTSYPISGSHFQPIPSVGTVFIHVYRANSAAPATCDAYTLAVSE